jgi:hypothetical protein
VFGNALGDGVFCIGNHVYGVLARVAFGDYSSTANQLEESSLLLAGHFNITSITSF